MEVAANIVDVLRASIYPGIIRIEGGVIKEVSRVTSKFSTYIMPGFIDSHVHVESSMLTPSQFARLAVIHGTVASISDPHEMANVLGMEGVKYMIDNGKTVPFKFLFGAPSCVPATDFETSEGRIDVDGVEDLFKSGDVGYLAEMMNYPGVIDRVPSVVSKIECAKKYGKPIDGHAPGLTGEALKRYVESGISTDHETLSYEEGIEKIHYGMKLLIREGSAAKNFDELFPIIERYPDMCMLCSDDKHPDSLVEGHIDALVRRGIEKGIGIMTMLKCACVNPVLHYGLNVGLLRPGDPADFIEVENLVDFRVKRTFIEGFIVAEDNLPKITPPVSHRVNNFKCPTLNEDSFKIRAKRDRVPVIEAINNQIITGSIWVIPKREGDFVVSDKDRDILKIAVVNRYRETRPALGFVKNFGLKRGAIASSVAHDSHNIVAVGVDDRDLCSAVNLVIKNRGGLAIANGTMEAVLPLPIGGLMSDGDGFSVAREYVRMDRIAKELGSTLDAPFMTLSFMSLIVIPKLKISDMGLFDGETFRFIDDFKG
ncbi:MAG: adenine deaminase [Syntrophorhabdaceae bacterium]|nr:adenine deaminase [Syntrophorhabdaceae bacterium]